MKILIVAAAELPIPAYKGGATETLMTELLEQDKIKRSLDLKVYSHCEGTDFIDENIKYFYLKKTWYEKIYFLVHLVLRLLSGKKKNIPDIFPLQIAKYENLDEFDLIILEGNKDQVIPIRKIYKGTLVLHIHTVMTLMSSTYKAKEIVEKCDYILANSSFAKKKIEEIDECTSKKVIEWKNCIKTESYTKTDSSRMDLRKRYGIEEDFVCIFCGRLEEGKGVLELIKAYKIADIPGKLVIVGASWFSSSNVTKYVANLQREAEKIRHKIIFTGYVAHEDIYKYYKMADIAIMPSIYEESAGLVALEAQASGLPTIVSNIGGLPEYINNESQLRIDVDENFIRSISNAICKLYHEHDFYKKEKKLAVKNASKYDIQTYGEEFLDIISKITTLEEEK